MLDEAVIALGGQFLLMVFGKPLAIVFEQTNLIGRGMDRVVAIRSLIDRCDAAVATKLYRYATVGAPGFVCLSCVLGARHACKSSPRRTGDEAPRRHFAALCWIQVMRVRTLLQSLRVPKIDNMVAFEQAHCRWCQAVTLLPMPEIHRRLDLEQVMAYDHAGLEIDKKRYSHVPALKVGSRRRSWSDGALSL